MNATVGRSDGRTVGGRAIGLRVATVPSALVLARAVLLLLGVGMLAVIPTLRPEAVDPGRATGGQVVVAEPLVRTLSASTDLIGLARRTTPFRLGGRPPAERFGAPPVSVTPPSPPVPKPQLALSGILWGREPAAIVEGVPGQEAPAVLRQGETIGPFRVIRIEAGRMVIQGMDTTWTLTVREPWK